MGRGPFSHGTRPTKYIMTSALQRLLIFGLCFVLAVGSTRLGLAAVPGDANNDGVVNRQDVQVIINHILQKTTAPGMPDCNQDGKVDVRDVICVTLSSLASTGSVDVSGTFARGGPDNWQFKCRKTTTVCAAVMASGAAPDGVYGVELKCDPHLVSQGIAVATTPGEVAQVCSECGKGHAYFFCDPASPACDDPYVGQISCEGERANVKQSQDQ